MRNVLALSLLVLAGACAQGTAAKPAASSAGRAAASCEQASLALPEDAVVAELEGQKITAKDLGPELAAAEQKALREYCAGIDQNRRMALDNYVTERLVKKAAAAAGKGEDEWVREQLMTKVGEPTDEEITKFYEARKSPDAPPLELVRPQVAAAIQREKAEGAIRSIIDELKKGSGVKEMLPDVRPAPVDLTAPAYTAVAGKKGGKVQVVEWADFECPYCSKAADTLSELKKKYGDRVEFSFRHFPLSFHPNARKAGEYAQCAGQQGKFWQMHDEIFKNQSSVAEEDMKRHAQTIGLDQAKLDACLASGQGAKEVEQDYQQGLQIGIEGTPSFFVNGRPHTGAPTVEALSAAIEAELSKT